VIRDALQRGSYVGTRDEEARLFYTALTRAERYLYVTGCATADGWARPRGPSPFMAHLNDDEIIRDANAPTRRLRRARPRRRIEASSLPTSYSDIRYFLRCPKDYQFRRIFGFSPAVPDLFGFGMTVHAAIGKLHQDFVDEAPSVEEAREVAEDMFHL